MAAPGARRASAWTSRCSPRALLPDPRLGGRDRLARGPAEAVDEDVVGAGHPMTGIADTASVVVPEPAPLVLLAEPPDFIQHASAQCDTEHIGEAEVASAVARELLVAF